MRFTRSRDLVIAAVVAGLLVHLGLRVGYGSLPPLPTLAGVTLLVIAVVEAPLGFVLRSRIQRRPGTRPVQPLTAARAVLVAKASSLVGALMLGAWLGVLVYVLPIRQDVTAAAHDTTSAVVGAISAAVLVGAALWLEHCCRTPDQPDDPDAREHR